MAPIPSQDRNSQIDYAALRSQVAITDVLEIVSWEPVKRHGTQLRGPCPVHQSPNPQSRSLSVNLEKNVYRCFGCDSQGNQLDLAAALFGKPLYAAALELCDRLGIEPPRRQA